MVDAAVLIANTANGNCLSQSSLRPFAYARSVSPMTRTPLPGPLHLALVFLYQCQWYSAEPTQ